MNMTERRIAFCVGNWSAETALYSWSFLRHCILRVRGSHPCRLDPLQQQQAADRGCSAQRVPAEVGGNEGALKLDPRDKLFIVHVGDKAERRRTSGAGRGVLSWDAGGPLIQPLQVSQLSNRDHQTPLNPTPPHPTPPHPTPPPPHPTPTPTPPHPTPPHPTPPHVAVRVQEALAAYEHTTVELQGGHVPSVILEWATDNDITLVVAGALLTDLGEQALSTAWGKMTRACNAGSRKAKGGKMIVKKAVPGEWGIGSTADAMLQITKLPLLVVQPDAVRSLGRANLRTSYVSEEQVSGLRMAFASIQLC